MRINKYIAATTGLSRRAADDAIKKGRVLINQQRADVGSIVRTGDTVTYDGNPQHLPSQVLLIFNKPAGYVCSRLGQGNPTIYELLPPKYHALKSIGRLDKDSAGLLLLTNNGKLANKLTHPRYAKQKIYNISLDKPLTFKAKIKIGEGVRLTDGLSQLQLKKLSEDNKDWQITMSEGRNRQIRRTFDFLGYQVKSLCRTKFGEYQLSDLTEGQWKLISQAANK